MRKTALLVAAVAGILMTAPVLGVGPAAAQGVDVRIGDSPRHRDGVVIREDRRVGPSVTIGQRRCKTVTVREWVDGRRVVRTIERCR